MTVLVHIEVHDGAPDDDALGILSAAREAGLLPIAVLVGSDVDDAVATVQRHGPSRVLVVDDRSLAGPDIDPRAAALEALIERASPVASGWRPPPPSPPSSPPC